MPVTERSEATRAAILNAARQLLSQRGYEGTTIRAVAASAGIDPSMVMRYYTNKAGLFRAAVDLDLHLDSVLPVAREQLGTALARHFLDRWEGDLSDEAITLLLRSASTNPTAAEQVRSIFATQIATFVTHATGEHAGSARRAGLMATQLVGVAFARYVVQIPPVVEMDAEVLARSIAPVLQHYLTGDLEEPVGAMPPS